MPRDDHWGGVPPPAIVSERYELLFEVAAGGMGTVYVGRRFGAGGFQRLVAIKRMHPQIAQDPEAIAAFEDEARIASFVQHANVVAIHDVCHEGTEHLLVMDYIDGASLATLLATLRGLRKRLARRVTMRILADALRGLHAAHELVTHDGRPLELVHRDATPHNILLGVDGSVRITDFGIARAAMRTVHTQPGLAKGKYCYMAPEQAFAEPLDRRADVFAMGVVAWEALTGRRLFENRTIQQVARGVALGEIPLPSVAGAGTPPDLDRIVMRALAPWREERYPTAAAFADAIGELAEREGGLAPSSAIADVLDLVCGGAIRERRERIRAVLGGLETASDVRGATIRPSSRTGCSESTLPATERTTLVDGPKDGVVRLTTPTSASIDVALPLNRVRSQSPGVPRARVAFLVIAGMLATAAGVWGLAAPVAGRATARRIGALILAREADFLARAAADHGPTAPCVVAIPGRTRPSR